MTRVAAQLIRIAVYIVGVIEQVVVARHGDSRCRHARYRAWPLTMLLVSDAAIWLPANVNPVYPLLATVTFFSTSQRGRVRLSCRIQSAHCRQQYHWYCVAGID